MMSFIYKKKSVESLALLSALIASTNAFTAAPVSQARPIPHHHHTSTKSTSTRTSTLHALIYGWDGQDETDTTISATSNYINVDSELGQTCSPVGSVVAEALSYDRDRAGHLARLAVAFSPPERTLKLGDIEHVDVVCVHDDSIEIQAVICEDGGCVSLQVPIQFPKACYHNEYPADQLEGCVLRNLDELDAEAGTILMVEEQKAAVEARLEELDGLCDLTGQFENYPSWWIPPECYAYLAADCDTVKQLLNEDEFQPDVNALAQDALRRIEEGEDYKVLQAKVAIVGPAGICFKVRAEHEYAVGRPVRILDVVHPFDQPQDTAEGLRAAVLGAVAAADGN